MVKLTIRIPKRYIKRLEIRARHWGYRNPRRSKARVIRILLSRI